MQATEFEGKTIDEAIERACNEWQVSRGKLNIEIIAEGTSGFLGLLGGKKAKITASLLSLEEELSGGGAISEPPRPAKAAKKSAGSSPQPPAAAFPATELSGGKTAARAKTILEGILARMNLDCPVTSSETEEKIVLNITGNGDGLLIGRRGQNLDAMQYIVNKAVHKSGNGRKMIIVDTESYRQRREESLTELAAKLGEKVKKTKKAVTLNYLNAHTRRIIHMALQDDLGITTKSRGEGEYRKIIIVPANKD
ncbi:MAG: RNA-binding cell elongation regulator Jag/EloR [Deltaproteobacteria bacterium]|nr:RNA-binding cell elongation regulator Jag/EloR [Deltaproteobacteria bacterium]